MSQDVANVKATLAGNDKNIDGRQICCMVKKDVVSGGEIQEQYELMYDEAEKCG
jgi:hypothetical protein